MFQKYFAKFTPKLQNRRRNTQIWIRKYKPSFLEKKPLRKYQKRKKNIFQKSWDYIYKNFYITPIYFGILAWLIFIIWWYYILFHSNFTQIQNINIYREWALININRAYDESNYLRWKNILSFNSKDLAQRLQKSQAGISKIQINKSFPSTLNIYLDSYKAIFQNDNYFILTNWAVTVKENDIFPDVPYIKVSEDLSIYSDFQNTLKIKEIAALQKLIEESKKNILSFNPIAIYYFLKEREIILQDSDNTLYIFDLEQDINKQVRKLAIYKKESPSQGKKSYIYVDVRVPEKLFLCEEEKTCKNNIINIYNSSVFDLSQ